MERVARRKTCYGNVLSTGMDKTVVVAIERFATHPIYRKIVRRITKLMAHDEQNTCKVGDRVRITETRPLSKRKRWRVVQVMERGAAET